MLGHVFQILEEVSRTKIPSKHCEIIDDGFVDVRRHNGALRTAYASLSIVCHIIHLRQLIENCHIIAALRELRGDKRFFSSDFSNIARASAGGIGWGGPEGYLNHVEVQA